MNDIRLAEINILIREMQHWGSKEAPYMIELFDYIMELRKEAKKTQKNIDFLNEAVAGWATQYDDLSSENEQMKQALVSIINGNWSCAKDKNNLEVWTTDRINPSRIARLALGGESP